MSKVFKGIIELFKMLLTIIHIQCNIALS